MLEVVSEVLRNSSGWLEAQRTVQWNSLRHALSIECSLSTFHSTSMNTLCLELGSAALEGPLGVGPRSAGLDSLKMLCLFMSRMSGS